MFRLKNLLQLQREAHERACCVKRKKTVLGSSTDHAVSLTIRKPQTGAPYAQLTALIRAKESSRLSCFGRHGSRVVVQKRRKETPTIYTLFSTIPRRKRNWNRESVTAKICIGTFASCTYTHYVAPLCCRSSLLYILLLIVDQPYHPIIHPSDRGPAGLCIGYCRRYP